MEMYALGTLAVLFALLMGMALVMPLQRKRSLLGGHAVLLEVGLAAQVGQAAHGSAQVAFVSR